MLVGQQGELVVFVGGAKAVGEMHERHTRLQGRGLGHEGEVMPFLHRARPEYGKAGTACRHDVLMITEDRRSPCGECPSRDIKYRRREFAGNLVHIGQHEHQALGCREGRRQPTAL